MPGHSADDQEVDQRAQGGVSDQQEDGGDDHEDQAGLGCLHDFGTRGPGDPLQFRAGVAQVGCQTLEHAQTFTSR